MPPFRFKRFSLRHEQSSMKVGTDGVLLGAWVGLPDYRPDRTGSAVLEIGCGCGLISLMLAQRLTDRGWPSERPVIDAIDIHSPSCAEATANVEASPWPAMTAVFHADFLHLPERLHQSGAYRLIVSNPPFFSQALKSPDRIRNTARHNDSLPFDALVSEAERLLEPRGRLALVLPPESFREIQSCMAVGGSSLQLSRLTQVYSKPGKSCERYLAEWRKSDPSQGVFEPHDVALSSFGKPACGPDILPSVPSDFGEDRLYIQTEDGTWHSDYRSVVEPFYLWA